MNPTLNTLNYIEAPLDYDGTQLSSHWIYRRFKLLGNSIVAFQGAADVKIEKMVDLEDVGNNAPIYSPKMLHFLAELFIDSFQEGILWQYLFIAQIYQELTEARVQELQKRGNDLYFKNRKLSVSICTKTTTSCLIHIGLNIESEGTPIPTSCLGEMGIDPKALAERLLENFRLEQNRIARNRFKTMGR